MNDMVVKAHRSVIVSLVAGLNYVKLDASSSTRLRSTVLFNAGYSHPQRSLPFAVLPRPLQLLNKIM